MNEYLEEIKQIIDKLDKNEIQKMIEELRILKERKGRLFILGVGGSAANASHAVNDFRRIANIEAYTPTDNIADITAVTNDYGWEWTFVKWLETVKLNNNDAILILSVGGGSLDAKVSQNIVKALDYAKECQAKILGIISRDGGYTRQIADTSILIPIVNEKNITPYAEAFQGILWHLIVNQL